MFPRRKFAFVSSAAVLLISTAMIALGCGSADNQTAGGSFNVGTGTTPLIVNIGDDPSDAIVSLELTVSNITLTDSAGRTVTILESPLEVELTHLAGILRTLTLAEIPRAIYTAASITIARAEVKFVVPSDPPTVIEREITAPITVSVNINLPAETTPVALNLDFDVGGSVTLTGSSFLFTPRFLVTSSALSSAVLQRVGEDDIEDTVGVISSISGTSFTLRAGFSDLQLALTTDASTEFENGLNGIGDLRLGMLVRADARVLPNGTLLAREVRRLLDLPDGLELEGLVLETSGDPVDQFQMVIHEGAGAPFSTTNIGGRVTVAVGSDTEYKIDEDADLGGLPFDANALFRRESPAPLPGQRVEIQTTTAANAQPILAATKVELEEQALVGVIENLSVSGSRSTFTLALFPQSAFSILTGASSVQVHKQANTAMIEGATLANGALVLVRGVVLRDDSTFRMIATRIRGRR